MAIRHEIYRIMGAPSPDEEDAILEDFYFEDPGDVDVPGGGAVDEKPPPSPPFPPPPQPPFRKPRFVVINRPRDRVLKHEPLLKVLHHVVPPAVGLMSQKHLQAVRALNKLVEAKVRGGKNIFWGRIKEQTK